jgi:hypothetical protein
MIAPRLQQILDNTKHPRAKALLQDLFENDEFKKNMCERLKQLVTEQRARIGYDMQAGTSGAWIWDDDELDEDLGSALMGLVKTAATTTAANALGVRPSTINNFTKHLTNRPKKYTAPQKPATAGAKPVQTKPAAKPAGASLHTSPIHHVVMLGDVHSKIGAHPGEHENHLSDFINHHNKAMELKAKGDKTGAAVQFRARNHALVRYNNTAPKAHLRHLNNDKVHQMMQIKE